MSLREAASAGQWLVWDDACVARAAPELFEPDWWRRRGALTGEAAGRGAAYFVNGFDGTPWVLRHNRRGGVLARCNRDRFVWTGHRRARPPAELRLLAYMRARELPVPAPVACRVVRGLGCYRGDVITRRIPGARPLAEHLTDEPLPPEAWRRLGQTLARFHEAGVWHADLNARNVLLDADGGFHLIDFDKSRLRAAGDWSGANLARLKRSLDKCARAAAGFRFTASDWTALRAGHQAVFARRS